MANYVADLQPELEVNYCRLVVVWTDDPASSWWYLGRQTVEELRMDLRALMAQRRDWWYDDTPAPYAQVVKRRGSR